MTQSQKYITPSSLPTSDDEQWYTPPSSPIPAEMSRNGTASNKSAKNEPLCRFPCTINSQQPCAEPVAVNRSVFAEIFPEGTRAKNDVDRQSNGNGKEGGRSKAIRIAELFSAGTSAKKDAEPRSIGHGRKDDNQAIRGQVINPLRLINSVPTSATERLPKDSKVELTAGVVVEFLERVEREPSLLGGLAEEITINTDLAGLLRVPAGPKEIGDLLNLFVFAADNYPPGISKAEREVFAPTRKEILKAMMKIGLLRAAYGRFVVELHQEITHERISDEMIRIASLAIELLLKAFLLLDKHKLNDDQETIALWQDVETSVFCFQPRFWLTISSEMADSLCHLAGQITLNGTDFYKETVRNAIRSEFLKQNNRRT